MKAIDWELAAVGGYYTAINFSKLFKNPQPPRFKKEGWFGKDTKHMGVDKLAHAYSTYIVSELLYHRLKNKTNDAPGIEWTAAALASGIMMWSEAFDSIEPDSGWSWEDVAMNTAGAGFSVLRNAVPGLDEKIDYRMMVKPNEDIYTISGQKHFEQQRYFFAIKPAGFKGMEDSPLRFTELHVGYHAKDFLYEDRDAGIEPKRHIFVGVGLNFNELLFKRSKSKTMRTVGEVTTYFQPPYSALHVNVTE
ncbi:YfiM family protein [Sphingomicrobium sp. B8]|uniref:YfiM family protein n=1 Tax=Sphingomicrobium clamense TaxID=2851013 RepID=A0ABS6V783_9SPHN|nr:YfiM family protein [Sphingomicrobium sp. B8]